MSANNPAQSLSLNISGISQKRSVTATPVRVSDTSLSLPPEVPIEELTKRYSYDPESGCLRWITASRCGKFFAGDRVGSDNGRGYRIFSFRYNGKQVKFYEHQVIWWFNQGYWSTEIDHINGVRWDNRIENLREVTRLDNTRNACRRKDNKSGVTGVVWHKAANKWLAQIRVLGQNIYLGLFIDLEEAVSTRRTAEVKYGFHPNHGRN